MEDCTYRQTEIVVGTKVEYALIAALHRYLRALRRGYDAFRLKGARLLNPFELLCQDLSQLRLRRIAGATHLSDSCAGGGGM